MSSGQMLAPTFLPTPQEIVIYDDPEHWYDLIFVLISAFCEVYTVSLMTQTSFTEE